MKNLLAKILGLAGMAAALTLTACNGSNNNNNPSNYPNCTTPGSFAAIYPINGSSGVPSTIQTIYVASSVSLGSQFQSVVGAPNGALYPGGGFTQVTLAQIPKPHASPGFSNPIYYSSFVGTLAPSSTWTILFNNRNISNCVPTQFMQFTTI